MKGSAVGLQADWQAPFCFSAAQSQEETDENQKLFSGPQCRAGRTLSGAGLRAAHGDGPSAAGRQYALPDAFPPSCSAASCWAGRGVWLWALRPRCSARCSSGCPRCSPIAISMAFELAAYGAVSGWLYRRVKHTLPMTYPRHPRGGHGGGPPRLGRGPLRAGGPVRLELPRSRPSCPVRSSPLCRASSHAGAHPPHRHRSAESKAHGLSLPQKMAGALRPQPFCFAYYLRRKSGRGLPCLSH